MRYLKIASTTAIFIISFLCNIQVAFAAVDVEQCLREYEPYSDLEAHAVGSIRACEACKDEDGKPFVAIMFNESLSGDNHTWGVYKYDTLSNNTFPAYLHANFFQIVLSKIIIYGTILNEDVI